MTTIDTLGAANRAPLADRRAILASTLGILGLALCSLTLVTAVLCLLDVVDRRTLALALLGIPAGNALTRRANRLQGR